MPAELINDPNMLVDDTSSTGSASDGDISWDASATWEKTGGALRDNTKGVDEARTRISNLIEVGKTYRVEYEVSGSDLQFMIWAGNKTFGAGDYTVGVHSFAAKIAVAVDLTFQGTLLTNGPPDTVPYSAIEYLRIREIHGRQIIREAAAGIVTGLTTTGANVFQSRVYNVQESELPCLLVYTNREEIERAQSIASPRRVERVLELIIEGKAQATSDLDDELDNIADEVEVAMGADPTLGIDAVDCVHSSAEIEYSSEGDQPIGTVIMRYEVTYITAEDAPGILL